MASIIVHVEITDEDQDEFLAAYNANSDRIITREELDALQQEFSQGLREWFWAQFLELVDDENEEAYEAFCDVIDPLPDDISDYDSDDIEEEIVLPRIH